MGSRSKQRVWWYFYGVTYVNGQITAEYRKARRRHSSKGERHNWQRQKFLVCPHRRRYRP